MPAAPYQDWTQIVTFLNGYGGNIFLRRRYAEPIVDILIDFLSIGSPVADLTQVCDLRLPNPNLTPDPAIVGSAGDQVFWLTTYVTGAAVPAGQSPALMVSGTGFLVVNGISGFTPSTSPPFLRGSGYYWTKIS